MQWLELENRELKQALSALKIVQSLHPEQRSDHNMHGDVAQSSHSCPGRNEGIIRAPGAQHATADEWIALMEEEERKKEVKKREAEERARLCEELRAKHAEQEAKVCALLSIKVGQRWCCNAQHCACLMQMASSYVDAIKIKENALPDLVDLLKWKHLLHLNFSRLHQWHWSWSVKKKKSWVNTLPTTCP